MTDYFDFYGLPLSFNLDAAAVKQQFYKFSKQYHPDFFINESEERQAEVLEMSTLNNKAYQVLSDPQRRLQYILEIKGILKEGENYVLPQGFLMEMMDVNESLMDLQFDPDPDRLDALKDSVSSIEQEINDEIVVLTANFELQDVVQQTESLVAIKDLFYRLKYLRRIQESIIKAAASL